MGCYDLFFFCFLWIDFAGAAGVEAGEAATAAEVRAAGTGSTRNGTASQPVSNCDVFPFFFLLRNAISRRRIYATFIFLKGLN